jgi:hypothetical protein
MHSDCGTNAILGEVVVSGAAAKYAAWMWECIMELLSR